MKSGRGRMLAASAFAALLAIGAFAWFISTSGPNEYGQVGQQINGMRTEHFDTFWSCALPREDVRDLDSPNELKAVIARFSASSGYVRIIRTDCMVHLEQHRAPLAALMPPAELTAGVGELTTALGALITAWTEYLAHLDRPDTTFDAEDPETNRLLTAVVQGWIDYRVAIGHINDTVREHLPE